MARPSLRTGRTGANADSAAAERRRPCHGLAALGTSISLALASGALHSAPGTAWAVRAAEMPPPPDAAAEALVARGARACSSALASRFSVEPGSVDVWLTPGLRIAIDSGEIGRGELEREGLQFGWMVRGRPAPAPIGLCRTRGNGSVLAIEEQKD